MNSGKAHIRFVVMALLLVFVACKKDATNKNSNSKNTPGVYIAGTQNDTAVYWKDGVLTKLEIPFAASDRGLSIFVANNNVYVAGINSGKACLWTNGALKNLASNNSGAYSVYVAGNDVYVAGSDNQNPVYWKNGVEHKLELSTGYAAAEAYSIFVSGNTVYAAGEQYTTGSGVATLWTNDTPTELVDPASYVFSYARSVFVKGNNVYVAGMTSNNHGYDASYWKNGALNVLSTASSSASSISVDDNDNVYILGECFHNSYEVTLWKNSQPVYLGGFGGLGEGGNCVFTSGSDVYAAGVLQDWAVFQSVYWKNNVPTNIGPVAENDTHINHVATSANGIFVVK